MGGPRPCRVSHSLVDQPAYGSPPFLLGTQRGNFISNQEYSPCSNKHPIQPEIDNTSPYESPDSKKFHEAAERALDHYLKPNALTLRFHKPSTMFQVAPDQDSESLLVHACESLAQASLMTSDIAAYSTCRNDGHSGDSADHHAG